MLLPCLLDRVDEYFSIICGLLPIEGVFGDLLDLALGLQDLLGCGSFTLVGAHG
jgi:hypothetical protein